MSSCQDLTNDLAPSSWSWAARASMSMPALANCVSTASQSPPSAGRSAPSSPCSARAFKVPSGMVFTVNGAARALMYRMSEASGSLAPVLAHSRRCGRAPALYTRCQRGELSRVRQALYVRCAMAMPSWLRSAPGVVPTMPAWRAQQGPAGLVRPLRHGDAELVAHRLGHFAHDRGVPAADEHRGDGADLGFEPGFDAPLDAAQERLGRRQVMLAGEQQCDIDRHAGKD